MLPLPTAVGTAGWFSCWVLWSHQFHLDFWSFFHIFFWRIQAVRWCKNITTSGLFWMDPDSPLLAPLGLTGSWRGQCAEYWPGISPSVRRLRPRVEMNCIKLNFSGSAYLQVNKTFSVWMKGWRKGTKTKEIKSILTVFKNMSENLQINLHFLFSYDRRGGTI